MAEIVYVLTNEAMEGLVKIGRTTTSVEQRIRELDNTSVPLPFQCFYAGEVKDSAFVESRLHQAFVSSRVRGNREFFRIDPNQVKAAIQIADPTDVTPRVDVVVDASDVQALKKAAANEERRSRLRFTELGVPAGAVLAFTKDPAYTCEVVADGKVRYKGEILSPAAAALKAIRALGYEWSSISGSDYWMFEEETLTSRRLRLEDESE
jgi:hypothetical protein